MKFRWIAAGVAGALLIGAGASDAASPKHKKPWKYYTREYCRDAAIQPSIAAWLFGARPKPEWNGCSPPVYSGGDYVGEDPDQHVRATLTRDPSQGYTDRY
ncbi:MAG TPA: hypothetical protein VFX37_13445 [Pseudolabrys sp.]|nr:hypothetical protein [Pseudolabrys sp.]